MTGCISFLNQPILRYSNEIRSAVLMIHGEKAHSLFFSKDAYAAMTDGNPNPENKALTEAGKGAFVIDNGDVCVVNWDMSGRGQAQPPEKRSRGAMEMKSIMIADTTREERERIVAEAIGNIDGMCDGCSPGLLRMYRDYIDGRMELREVNMAFNARYTSGAQGPDRVGCGEAKV